MVEQCSAELQDLAALEFNDGAYACLSEDVDCYTVAPITVGANATVSQGVKLCTASNDISSPIMELTYAPITIGGNALVAGWTVVLPGVTIGEGAVVDAGSVVVKDVEPWVVVGGRPAYDEESYDYRLMAA